MKKILKTLFICALFASAILGIREYYYSLPIRGAYETRSIQHPVIDKAKLKSQLSIYSFDELHAMQTAGLEAMKWQGLLGKVNSTVFSDIIKDFSQFYISERYPDSQIEDYETQSTYFYHSHRPNEHGHFHIYFDDEKVMEQFKPIATWDQEHHTSHLGAISMHPDGTPIGILVPNNWVSKDWWYKPDDMMKIMEHFEVKHPYPSWPSNQWLNQMLKLFHPQFKEALELRDKQVESSNQPREKFLKNRKVDELAYVEISIPDQMEVISELLTQKASK